MYEQEEATRNQMEMVQETDPPTDQAQDITDEDNLAELSTAAEAPPIPEAADSPSDPDPTAPHDPSAAAAFAGELESLRQELMRLKEALEAAKSTPANISGELEEFRSLYPGISPDQIPDDVWEHARQGVPIAAAYALACRKKERPAELARSANLENAARSTGALEETRSGYFTPEEVRAMSASEVRKNYSRIMLSMQKWH